MTTLQPSWRVTLPQRKTLFCSICLCSGAQSCLTLCDPMDCSPSGSSVHGILQERILEWVAISSSRGLSRPRDQTHISYVSCTADEFSTHWAIREALFCSIDIQFTLFSTVSHKLFFSYAAAKSLQLCLTLCNPTDGRPPGSPVPRILQTRILEWVPFTFSNACMHAKSLQSCLTLRDPTDSSPPGSSVHRIL